MVLQIKNPFMRYVLSKAIMYTVLWFLAVFLNFLLPRIMPGDPIRRFIERVYTMGQAPSGGAAQIIPEFEKYMKEAERLFGLNQPPYLQFPSWFLNFIRGDWGFSISYLNLPPVKDLVMQALPYTLALLLPSLVVSWIIGNYLGAYLALKGGKADKVGLSVLQFIAQLPTYWLLIILIFIFYVKLRWVPPTGRPMYMIPSLSWDYIRELLRCMALPLTTLTIVGIGGWSIGMRAYVIYQLNSDYIKYARSLGLPQRVLGRYAFRNALIPQFTAFAINFGGMFAGNLLVEMIYGYPGMGALLATVIANLDIFAMQAIFTFTATMLLLANFAADIIYGFLDPRIRRGVAEVIS
jgi:peptide/nickel transport system permease protein